MIHKGKPRYMGTQSDNFECYIENKSLDAGSKGAKIPLLFSPNSLSDNVAANFNQQSIPGGSAPVITYSGTGARTVSLDFFVPIDYLPPNTDFRHPYSSKARREDSQRARMSESIEADMVMMTIII